MAVETHADNEGRRVYAERRHDVEVCGFPVRWAWPWPGADETYIVAIGVALICNDIGIPESTWGDWDPTWRAAFKNGYEAAHKLAGNLAEETAPNT